MKTWRHSGFHAYAGEEIPDIEDALRVGLYMHIRRRFDPLKLPGRSPPLLDGFCPDPFPDYGPL